MAANIVHSEQAVRMSVYVIRAFVRLRDELLANATILKRLAEIDRTLLQHDTVLRDWSDAAIFATPVLLDRYSCEGRRAIARFHSDAEFTMKGGAPHWYCRIFKRRQRNADTRELLRWLADPGYDPVMQSRHRNSATWSWW